MQRAANQGIAGRWWLAITGAQGAAAFISGEDAPPRMIRFVVVLTVSCYALYGLGMGLFTGPVPALWSAVKMPMLYGVTMLVCLLPFYVFGALLQFQFRMGNWLRMLLLFGSAHAAALASYAPVAFFFSMTTSDSGYPFLVVMHVAVLAFAGAASLGSNFLVFRATSNNAAAPGVSRLFVWLGILYAAVGTQAAWTLRPWLNKPTLDYQPIRPIGGSFIQSVFEHISTVAGA